MIRRPRRLGARTGCGGSSGTGGCRETSAARCRTAAGYACGSRCRCRRAPRRPRMPPRRSKICSYLLRSCGSMPPRQLVARADLGLDLLTQRIGLARAGRPPSSAACASRLCSASCAAASCATRTSSVSMTRISSSSTLRVRLFAEVDLALQRQQLGRVAHAVHAHAVVADLHAARARAGDPSRRGGLERCRAPPSASPPSARLR